MQRIIVLVAAGLLASAALAGQATTSRAEERNTLVDRYIVGAGIDDDRVIEAMRTVPRHLFVPPGRRDDAYDNRPLAIGYGQTISQPYIVAYMTEALELEENARVLEIGTGSGYQAAVLAEAGAQVYSIEIIPELVESARDALKSAGYSEVTVKQGDGYYGWKEHAPFDGIIVTAASDHVPPPLIRQLKPGAVIIIPVGAPYSVQTLLRIRKLPDGTIERDALLYVRFVPFTRM